jgi:uncharacterized membrane protein YphA (DoxX/SURF4 family)
LTIAQGRRRFPPASSLIALLPRLYLGMIFTVAAHAKLTAPHGFAVALSGFLNGMALQQGFPWYARFLSAVVLPRPELFAILVTVAEIAVAVGMLSGIATRPSAVLAIFLMLNYAFAKGLPLWSAASNDMADIVLAIIVFAGTGRRRTAASAISGPEGENAPPARVPAG